MIQYYGTLFFRNHPKDLPWKKKQSYWAYCSSLMRVEFPQKNSTTSNCVKNDLRLERRVKLVLSSHYALYLLQRYTFSCTFVVV